MDRKEFKEALEKHKNQIDVSTKHLQMGLDHFNKRNYDFYQFTESNYFDIDERMTRLERKVESQISILSISQIAD